MIWKCIDCAIGHFFCYHSSVHIHAMSLYPEHLHWLLTIHESNYPAQFHFTVHSTLPSSDNTLSFRIILITTTKLHNLLTVTCSSLLHQTHKLFGRYLILLKNVLCLRNETCRRSQTWCCRSQWPCWGVALPPLACWDCGFESRPRYMSLSYECCL